MTQPAKSFLREKSYITLSIHQGFSFNLFRPPLTWLNPSCI